MTVGIIVQTRTGSSRLPAKVMMKADDERNADNDVALAILRAKDQLELASDANELISLEQETIEAIDGLQEELEAKG